MASSRRRHIHVLFIRYDIDLSAVQEIDNSFWHVDCLEEYADEQIADFALMD
ncbi:MAG: hypothetical protein J7M12_05980 [Candidatus Hydrogenedentes bacterium]|nr:hypothetical protein [Candidatus Hydrogenedentota bacterium]